MKTQSPRYLAPPILLTSVCLLYAGNMAFGHPESECKIPEVGTEETCPPNSETPPESDFPELASTNVFFRSNGGYIDSALIRNQFRVRYDWNENADVPDRAEFIYGQCDCGGGPSPGPALDFDSEELEITYEYAFSERFSIFTEIPYRFIDLDAPVLPDGTPARELESDGISDLRAGFKYALISDAQRYLTLQLKGYFSTGDEAENLGTGHDSIEPGLLYYQRLDEDWTLETEARWWHPINGTDYEGDILRFGAGVSYNGFGTDIKLAPVAEVVGWYVLDGKKTTAKPIRVLDADSDTIMNLKLGVRLSANGIPGSLYLGYGFALTDQVWYDDMFRVEYRIEAFN